MPWPRVLMTAPTSGASRRACSVVVPGEREQTAVVRVAAGDRVAPRVEQERPVELVVVGAARGALVVAENGSRREEDAPAGTPEAQAEVDVLVVGREVLVEAAELVEEIAPHQHARGRDGRDLPRARERAGVAVVGAAEAAH